MYNEVNQRLRLFMKQNKLTIKNFALSVGTTEGTIKSMFSRNNNPSAGLLTRIATAYPNLNSSWLLTGDGDMLNNAKNVKIGDNNTGVFANTGNIKGNVNNVSIVLPEQGYVKILRPDGTIEIQHESFIENAQQMLQEAKAENEDLRKQILELNKTLFDTQKELITYLKNK